MSNHYSKSDFPSTTDARFDEGRLFLETNLSRLLITDSEKNKIRRHAKNGVKLERTPSGIPNLLIDGVSIYERESPIETARRQVALIEAEKEPTIAVLFGLGLGYHAEQMERRFDCPLIVYDPSLSAISATLGARLLNLKQTILVTDPAHLTAETQPRLQFNDRRVVAAAVPSYRQLFPEAFESFVNALKQASADASILENTLIQRSPDWMYHALKNAPKAADKLGVDILSDKFSGKPGILVSAGPSLDKNIGALKAAEGRAVIVAVNAAAAPLAKAGVKPDFIAVVEGLDLRAQLDTLPWLDDVVLVPTLNCFPGFFELKVRRIMPMADYSVACSEWFAKAYHWRQFPSGGSVACNAFSLLHVLGCDPIIVIGQDLAYTAGKSYSEAATFGKQSMRFDEESNRLVAVETERNTEIERIRTDGGLSVLDNLSALEVEAYGGNATVHTIGIFNMFRFWFETAATWTEGKHLINATEGGARIKNFEEMPLVEAVSKYCTEPVAVKDMIEEICRTSPPDDIRILIEIIRDDVKMIRSLIETSQEASASAAEALSEIEAEGIVSAEPALRRLSGLESALRAISSQNRVADAFLATKVNRLRVERYQDYDEDPNKQTANSLRRTLALLDKIREGCQELETLFVSLISRLEEMET